MKQFNSSVISPILADDLSPAVTQGAFKAKEGVTHAPDHPTTQSYLPYSNPETEGFGRSHQNQKPFTGQDYNDCAVIKSEPELWAGLITEWCDHRDKPRLRECLDGLRGDGTLTQSDRQGIWRGLSKECRVMCQSVAGGEHHG